MDNLPILAPGPNLPLSRAAVGPNFSEGQPFFARWIGNKLSPGHSAVIPANYGQEGSIPFWNRMFLNLIGQPLEPARLPHKPVWNILVPTVNWNLQVLTQQQLQSFENSQDAQAPQLPMTFSAPTTASLFK